MYFIETQREAVLLVLSFENIYWWACQLYVDSELGVVNIYYISGDLLMLKV